MDIAKTRIGDTEILRVLAISYRSLRTPKNRSNPGFANPPKLDKKANRLARSSPIRTTRHLMNSLILVARGPRAARLHRRASTINAGDGLPSGRSLDL